MNKIAEPHYHGTPDGGGFRPCRKTDCEEERAIPPGHPGGPPLPPRVKDEVDRILSRIARRFLEEELALIEQRRLGTLGTLEREYLELIEKHRAGELTEAENKRYSDFRSRRVETNVSRPGL